PPAAGAELEPIDPAGLPALPSPMTVADGNVGEATQSVELEANQESIADVAPQYFRATPVDEGDVKVKRNRFADPHAVVKVAPPPMRAYQAKATGRLASSPINASSSIPVQAATAMLRRVEDAQAELDERDAERGPEVVAEELPAFVTATVPDDARFEFRVTQVTSMTLPATISRVRIGDSSVCRVVAVQARHLRILGCGEGKTNIEIEMTESADSVPTKKVFQCRVISAEEKLNVIDNGEDALKRLIKQRYPTSQIRMQTVRDRLVVSGSCDGNDEASEIIRMIRKARLVRVDDQIQIR
ncbi:MAG: pilus assembly protein N-terminal domain-containing protein, partial [Planctomycetota bacterium]